MEYVPDRSRVVTSAGAAMMEDGQGWDWSRRKQQEQCYYTPQAISEFHVDSAPSLPRTRTRTSLNQFYALITTDTCSSSQSQSLAACRTVPLPQPIWKDTSVNIAHVYRCMPVIILSGPGCYAAALGLNNVTTLHLASFPLSHACGPFASGPPNSINIPSFVHSHQMLIDPEDGPVPPPFLSGSPR